MKAESGQSVLIRPRRSRACEEEVPGIRIREDTPMARLNRRHKLEGFSGKVGKNLRLSPREDGRVHVGTHDEEKAESNNFPHWQIFKEAVAYARKMHDLEAYHDTAEKVHDTPFHVATADFLHPPEITEIDLSAYNGRPGDVIRVRAEDDVQVAQVGVLITDEENHLIEMGMAKAVDSSLWSYTAHHQAPTRHVRVIVDAADLPGHLDEARVEKDLR
jgi:hypothetical protein